MLSPVTGFSVAVNESYVDRAGEKRDDTTWFRVSAWNKLAETCNEYLSKGKMVLVTGRVKLRTWEGDDGQPRSNIEVTATNVTFLSAAVTVAEVVEGKGTRNRARHLTRIAYPSRGVICLKSTFADFVVMRSPGMTCCLPLARPARLVFIGGVIHATALSYAKNYPALGSPIVGMDGLYDTYSVSR